MLVDLTANKRLVPRRESAGRVGLLSPKRRRHSRLNRGESSGCRNGAGPNLNSIDNCRLSTPQRGRAGFP